MICSSTQKIRCIQNTESPLKTMADELAEYYFVKSGQSQLVNLRHG